MIDKGIHVVRGGAKRNNANSRVVEHAVKLMKQMIRRMDSFELA